MEVFKFKEKKKDGYMIRVNSKEAIEIIESLAAQMTARNPNVGRKEFFDKNGHYFSISVVE